MPPEEHADDMQDWDPTNHHPDAEGSSEQSAGEAGDGVAEETDSDQERIQREIDRRIARERRRWEKTLERTFGTRDLGQAGQIYRAGRMVVEKSGRSPGEVIQRLSSYPQGGGSGSGAATTAVDDDVRRELAEIKSTLQTSHEERVREQQETEARKEFGQLYDEHAEEIADYADEYGLSLIDAAAAVLRPHLKEHFARQTRERQQAQRRRSVPASEESPSKGRGDYASRLSDEQKRVAKKMGLSYERYYTQLQRLGRVN